ncbi:MAG: hypothetical protein JXL81_09550 [Deltaproteobacteria bacterium]|nr:hypothetical protein [Deltaproteobacteria bacterium]
MDKLIDAIIKYTLGAEKKDSPSEIECDFSFDKDFIGFLGHFPGYPILPGVLQLLLAQILIEKQNGCNISVTGILKAKFLSEIRPNDRITVQCVDTEVNDSKVSKVKISCGDRQVSSFNMNYAIRENSRC